MAKSSEFEKDIVEMLQSYCGELNEKMFDEAQRLTKEAQSKLKDISPKDTGDYAKSWRLAKFGKKSTRFRFVIHNEEYRLTHLLEEGFTHHPDMRQVKGQPHIDEVQEWLNSEFEAACEKIIKNT